jgi:hypothetical protein
LRFKTHLRHKKGEIRKRAKGESTPSDAVCDCWETGEEGSVPKCEPGSFLPGGIVGTGVYLFIFLYISLNFPKAL